jgi:hypothetical protein
MNLVFVKEIWGKMMNYETLFMFFPPAQAAKGPCRPENKQVGTAVSPAYPVQIRD